MARFFVVPIFLLHYFNSFSQPFTRVTIDAFSNYSFLNDVDVADYNSDGHLDVIIQAGDSSFIFKNDGTGNFALATSIFSSGMSEGIVKWADFDGDGDLDLLILGDAESEVYLNVGGDTFEKQTKLEANVNYDDVDYADYDHDGDLDVIVAGKNSRLHQNTGGLSFSKVSLNFKERNAIRWGDINNDGWVDLVLSSWKNSDETEVHLNDQNGDFGQEILLPLKSNFIDIADYDSDGWLDIVASGILGTNDFIVVFRNNGDNTFTESFSYAIDNAANVKFTDINNDGLSDILTFGENSSASLLVNNGDHTFSKLNGVKIEAEVGKGFAIGDYDSDGDLDIFTILDGLHVWKNDISIANNTPKAPENLGAIVDGEIAYFSWNEGSDQETASSGLSYNLYLYKESESEQIRPAHAFDQTHPNDGIRKVVKRGDVQVTINYPIHNLKSGTYYWSVQTIDAGLKGSKFAPEQSFQIISLSSVDYNVAKGILTNTTIDFEYSLTSTDGLDGNWQACDDNVTSVDFGNGGFDLYVREAKNTANFRWLGYVDVPSAGPVFTIDFANERTNETVPSEIEYSLNSDMSSSVEGDNSNIEVTPGVHIFFRIRTNDSTLASMTSELVVPLRPSAPYFDIDFFNERTYELVADNYEYGLDFDLSDPVPGSNEYVDLIPGQDLFFREKATLSSFKSEVFTLEVDDRPLPPTNPVLYTTENYFGWTNSPGITRTDRYECSLDSGQVWEKCMSNPFYVGNNYLQIGVVQVRVMATDSNFESLALLSTGEFNAPVEPPIITSNNDMDFEVSIYPNPVQDRLTVNSNHSHFQVHIFSTDGLSIRSEEVSRRSVSLDINDLTSGVYILTISIDGKVPLKQIFVKN